MELEVITAALAAGVFAGTYLNEHVQLLHLHLHRGFFYTIAVYFRLQHIQSHILGLRRVVGRRQHTSPHRVHLVVRKEHRRAMKKQNCDAAGAADALQSQLAVVCKHTATALAVTMIRFMG